MEIVEVGKKKANSFIDYIKKNPAMVLIGGAGVVGVLYLLRSGGSSAGTNNVETVETVYTDGYNNITDNLNGVATIYSQSDVEKILDGIYDYVDDSMSEVTKVIDQNQTETDKNIDSINDKLYDLTGEQLTSKEYETLSKNMATITANVNKISNSVNDVNKKVNNLTNSKKSSGTKKSSGSKKTTTSYYKKTSYKGVSIVDALKSIGVNSSFDFRKKIAKANGISNYTGTASQNTSLLNKLKAGKLKKA